MDWSQRASSSSDKAVLTRSCAVSMVWMTGARVLTVPSRLTRACFTAGPPGPRPTARRAVRRRPRPPSPDLTGAARRWASRAPYRRSRPRSAKVIADSLRRARLGRRYCRSCPNGNAGVNPGLSRNCHRGAILHHATAAGPEGGGERRSGSQDTERTHIRTSTRMETTQWLLRPGLNQLSHRSVFLGSPGSLF